MQVSGEEIGASCVYPLKGRPSQYPRESHRQDMSGMWVPWAGQHGAALQMDSFKGVAGALRGRSGEGEPVTE